MSIKPPGGADMATDLLAQAKLLIEQAEQEEAQLALTDPVSAEEWEEARAEIGPKAGTLATLKHAREKRSRGGRNPGSRNRRTEDFRRYLLAHGRDPALTLMEIQNTQPELLVERSRDLDPLKRRMSLADAQSLRIRCAEALMPFIHSKQPIAIDSTIRGIIVHETIGEVRGNGENPDIIDGEFLDVMPFDGEADSR